MKTLVANWKMQLGVRESVALARGVLRALRGRREVPNVLLAPSFPAIPEVVKALGRSRVHVAAQNMHEEESGAYTGEVSAKSLKELGVRAVIIGHSERRAFFGEDDVRVARKAAQAVLTGVHPIVCVGEPLAVREAGEAAGYVHDQLAAVFGADEMPRRARVTVAYEPIWAIGTGVTASVHDVAEMHAAIRTQLSSYGMERVQVLYGGSVTPENAYEFLHHEAVDGVLVGGASTRLGSLVALLDILGDVTS